MSENIPAIKTDFKASTIEPFFTGGKVSLSSNGKTLATICDTDVIVTNFETGERLTKIRGVS